MSKGLLTLQTDLKSLRYGNDKPYITKDINNAPSSNQSDMRGTKRVDDLSRIAQMLVDRPGLKHLGNEALLRQVGVQERIEKSRKSGKTVAGAILKEVGGTLLNTVKIVGSTLIQVPVNGTGTHFLRGFRTDTYLQPSNGNTRSGFAQFFGAGGVEGAPSALKGEEIVGTKPTDFVEGIIPTGKIINPNTGKGSKFQYDAPVRKDGDGGTNWNEKTNTSVADWATRQDTNRSYAASGKVIPVGKIGTKPVTGVNADTGEVTTLPGFDIPFQQASKVETTLASGSLGISNTGIEGDISQGGQSAIKPFKEEDQIVKTKNTTKENIGNALVGSIIPLIEAGKDTTAVRGDETSLVKGVSNHFLDVESDLIGTDNGNDGSQKYSSDSTYTGKSAVDNISSVLEGKRIYTGGLSGSYRQTSFAQDYQPTYKPFADPMQISAVSKSDETTGPSTKIEDFRQKNDANLSSYKYDYNSPKVHKEQRVNLGNQGRAKNRANYMTTNDLDIDKVNASDVSNSRLDGTDEGRDLAKFYFEIITPDETKFLHFRAFINSVDDGYTADWQGHKYVGRAEDFYTYGGFSRDINVSFTIAAATRKEMRPLYRKMVYLASATAPTYGTGGLMRGTLARLTLGSYFSQIPGVITSVKFTLDNESPWEISLANPDGGTGNATDDDVQELPMVLQCSVSFKPIHDFAPQTGFHHYFTNPDPQGGAKSFLK
jgi:hypothetical protein